MNIIDILNSDDIDRLHDAGGLPDTLEMFVAILKEHDFAIVPREPIEPALVAGLRSQRGMIAPDMLRTIYRVMVSASENGAG